MSIKTFAANVVDILALGGESSIAVAGDGAIAYSEAFSLPEGNPTFSFEYQATSSGSIALKIELEQGNQEPESEGSADDNFVVPDDAAEFNNSLTDELSHIKAYEPAATAFARFKITGLAGNDALTVISKLKASIIK